MRLACHTTVWCANRTIVAQQPHAIACNITGHPLHRITFITGHTHRQRSTSSIEGGYAVTGDIHRGNIVSMSCQRQCNAWCCGTQRVTAVVSCAGIHPRTEKAPRISLYPLDAPRFFLRAYGASPASGHDLRWSRCRVPSNGDEQVRGAAHSSLFSAAPTCDHLRSLPSSCVGSASGRSPPPPPRALILGRPPGGGLRPPAGGSCGPPRKKCPETPLRCKAEGGWGGSAH